MDEPYDYDANYTILGLEREMRTTEAAGLTLKTIAVQGGRTVGVFVEGDVGLRSLALWVDPLGTATGPKGATVVCRGMAMVSGAAQKVAAFRKG